MAYQPNFDNLTLLPSTKIIYFRNGQLRNRPRALSKLVDNCKINYEASTPVSVLSILGSPSNEKYLLVRSFIDHYEGDWTKDPIMAEVENKSYHPEVEIDLNENGVYLINKPLYLDRGTNGGSLLIWIFYIYRGDPGRNDEIRLLERFLLLASSRIAEVKFENEQFGIFQQWQELHDHLTQAKSSVPHLCTSYLFLFPRRGEDNPQDHQRDIVVSNSIQSKQRLRSKMTSSSQDPSEDISLLNKMRHINLIEMNSDTVLKDLYTCNIVKAEASEKIHAYKNLRRSIKDLHDISPPMIKIDKSYFEVELGNFVEFIRETARSLNETLDTSSPASASQSGSQQPGQASGERNPKLYSLRHRIDAPEGNTKSVGIPTYDVIEEDTAPNQPAQRNTDIDGTLKNMLSQGQSSRKSPTDNLAGESTTTRTKRLPPAPGDACTTPDYPEASKLANTIMPHVLTFYDAEMKRFLVEDVYPPHVLQVIHSKLASELVQKFEATFMNWRISSSQRSELASKLMSSLNIAFDVHRQQNATTLKKQQGQITKCLQRMMSSYMEKIEVVLAKHPNGLESQNLINENGSIVDEVISRMTFEISKIRKDEPVTGHINSLQMEVEDYWECVQERNNQNYQRDQLYAQLQDVSKRLEAGDGLSVGKDKWNHFKGEWKYAKSVATNVASTLEEIEEQMAIVLKWYDAYRK